MKLYSVHCGYYDRATGDGVYESHVNLFVVATDFADAKKKAKQNPRFKEKKMHVDGLQEISVIDGYRVVLEKTDGLEADNQVNNLGYDEIKALKQNTTKVQLH
ncbi:MAG: DUF1543 domain-containing protein [Bdellovibrionaceae bacterium]|nr:DUF1543 domain-containing protein [Bdellovibrionales bacterium]MCB9254209.1 DUF1543 domain-containing protein [Pseudobdellovibrionaceae bacterium]